MRGKSVFVAVAAVALLGGCNRDGRTVRYEDLYTGDVLVEVGGARLTKAKLERDVKFRLALEAHRNPKQTVAAAKEMERGLYEQGIGYFLTMQAYVQEAAARGIRAGLEDLEFAQTRFLKRYTRGRSVKWGAFVKSLDPSLAEGLEEDLCFEALRMKVDAELRKLPVEPMPAAELDRLHAERTAFGERQSATNALIYANATNLWRRIVSGKSSAEFTEIGKALAEKEEHVLFDEQYGPYDAEFLKDSPELVALLPKLRLNGVTPPVENDNGLAILKLQAIDNSAPLATTPRQPRYVFSRIFFELPELVEPYTKEELGRIIDRQHAEEMPSKVIGERVKRLRANYPNGKVVFGK